GDALTSCLISGSFPPSEDAGPSCAPRAPESSTRAAAGLKTTLPGKPSIPGSGQITSPTMEPAPKEQAHKKLMNAATSNTCTSPTPCAHSMNSCASLHDN